MRISDWSSDVCSSDLFWRDRRRQQQVRSRAGYLGELGVGFRPLPQTPPSPPMCGKAGYSSTTRSSPKSACRNSLETSERGLPGFLGKIRIRHSISRRISMRTGKCRSEEHTSELQSLMRNSYAVFCLKKKISYHIPRTKKMMITIDMRITNHETLSRQNETTK